MAKPTKAEVRGLFESDLGDPELDKLIDAEDAEVVYRFGEHATQVDELEGGHDYLYLTRPATSITSVVESIGDDDTTLVADDYTLRDRGWSLEREPDGTNQRRTWGTRLIVSYVPVADARRTLVIIDLVKLAAQHQGLSSVRDGDFRADLPNYQPAREAILSTLNPRQRMVA